LVERLWGIVARQCPAQNIKPNIGGHKSKVEGVVAYCARNHIRTNSK
jgi:hypothetical protein